VGSLSYADQRRFFLGDAMSLEILLVSDSGILIVNLQAHSARRIAPACM
jgi:hypothetical protein